MASGMDSATHSLSGEKEKKPKKELHEIRTSKAKSGGYVHVHHHTHPDHAPETHVSADDAAMLGHMQNSMGANAAPSGDPAQADPAMAPADASAAGGAAPAAVPGT